MKIRLVTLMAGPAGVNQPGEELDLPEPEARRLVEAGSAIALELPERGARRGKATESESEG